MPVIKTKRELSVEAVTLAQSFEYVFHQQQVYVPADYETGDTSVIPDQKRTIWIPLTKGDIQVKAQQQFNTLFETDSQLSSFSFMVAQAAELNTEKSTSLLVRTDSGLRELREDGCLHEPTGEFVANTLLPRLNEDQALKTEVFEQLSEWLDSSEEATALLRHMATTLAPGWSAVKYVLLLGEGRNGKSLLMTMLQKIFGRENCAGVSRQDICDKSPVVAELNGKLLNIVMDGQAVYLKDSGLEKSLIAGEEVGIRKLYSSELTPVQTNALFMEGLNREPKSSDKTSALQARIIRFEFPNVYPDDREFWNKMTDDAHLGALLSLLIDNYVKPSDTAVMLAPTQKSLELQAEHQYENLLGLQFIKYVHDTDPLGTDVLVDMGFTEFVAKFKSWRITVNDLRVWSEPDVINVLRPVFTHSRKSERVNGIPRKVRYITGFTKEAIQFMHQLKEVEDDTSTAAMVED